MGTGLKLGKAIGATIDPATDANLARTCRNYSLTLQHHLLAVTPVYDAVLPRMIDFGDENLSMFVRFYGFFYDFQQGLKDVDEAACQAAAAEEITYMEHQVNGGLGFYKLIADTYPITAPELGVPQPASSAPPPAASSAAGG
jgi:hypothetical protein